MTNSLPYPNFRRRRCYWFRFAGVGVTVLFHIVAITYCYFICTDGGWLGLGLWFLPSFILGMPWSILTSAVGCYCPPIEGLGLIFSLILNGYLVGWACDAIVMSSRTNANRRPQVKFNPPTHRMTENDQIVTATRVHA